MKVYVVTVKSHPWLLPPVEEALRNSDVGAAGDVSKLARNIRAPGGRPISDDQALVAFNALSELAENPYIKVAFPAIHRYGELWCYTPE